jgi:hypothetical protein
MQLLRSACLLAEKQDAGLLPSCRGRLCRDTDAWKDRGSPLAPKHGTINMGGQVDDASLVRVVEAIHGVIILRFGNHLNSGLLPLVLTLGTPVIAPTTA